MHTCGKLLLSLALLSTQIILPVYGEDIEESEEETRQADLTNIIFALDFTGLSEEEISLQKEFYLQLAQRLDLTSKQAAIACQGQIILDYSQSSEELTAAIQAADPSIYYETNLTAAELLNWSPDETALITAQPLQGLYTACNFAYSFSGQAENTATQITADNINLRLQEVLLTLQPDALQADEEEAVQEESETEENPVLIDADEEQTVSEIVTEEETDYTELQEETAGTSVQYTVLVLDTSGSLYTESLAEQKQYVKDFCASLLEQEDVENYVALVTFDTKASILCPFTNDEDALYKAANRLKAGNLSNISDGLESAAALLAQIDEEAQKNIVLCTDGIPETGSVSTEGTYTEEDATCYPFANAALQTAQRIKKSVNIYTIGSYASIDESMVSFARDFLTNLSSNEQYYEASTSYFLSLCYQYIAQDIQQENSIAAAENVSMYVDVEKTSLTVEDTEKIHVTFQPAIAEQPEFISSAPEILTVSSSGVVTARKPGSATVEIRAADGQSEKITFKVYAKYDVRNILGWI